MTDRSKILDKLKKMMAHARSAEAIGSEQEAATFAAMIQTMIARHNIDKAELTSEERAAEDTVNPIEDHVVPEAKVRTRKGRRVQWLDLLGDCVSYAHFCQMLVSRTDSRIWFVGRHAQVEMCLEVFTRLVEVAEQIADKEYVKYFYECKDRGDVRAARGFRGAFLDGFAIRMRDRYLRHMEELDQEAARKAGALVLFRDERQQVKDFVESLYGRPRIQLLVRLQELGDERFLAFNPVLLQRWNRGWRWAVVKPSSGKLLTLGLHPTHEAAEEALEKRQEEGVKAHAGKRHVEGLRRGSKAADGIDLGGPTKQHNMPLPKERP